MLHDLWDVHSSGNISRLRTVHCPKSDRPRFLLRWRGKWRGVSSSQQNSDFGYWAILVWPLERSLSHSFVHCAHFLYIFSYRPVALSASPVVPAKIDVFGLGKDGDVIWDGSLIHSSHIGSGTRIGWDGISIVHR
jgi:hypothetical protein